MTIDSFLSQLCEHCGVAADDITVTVEENDEEVLIQLELPESESGLFIGYHGETLDSIQRITRLAFQREMGEKRIRLNINQYREQRQEKLADMALSIAEKVVESGESHTIGYYLPAHERFLIHSTLSEHEEYSEKVESVSNGQGRDRRITIQAK